MTRKAPYGKRMRETHFAFSPSYTPLNHGSFGASPILVQERQRELQKLEAERPDTFIVFDLPKLIDASREAVAPLLGAPVDEIVFVPNATTGINTVLRNLRFEEGDVIVHFSTIYDSCEKTIFSIGEMGPLRARSVVLEYPIEDEEVVRRFREMVGKVRSEGLNVKIAMFDTVLTFPGVRMPWEELVEACRELGVLSLIDGAHGIGHIDLQHLGKVSPDFFVSNCHKWLYTPRACAVFYVPFRNQHLIRTCLPTSHGYRTQTELSTSLMQKSDFVMLFEFVATIDYSPYCCIPAALKFRNEICSGEEAIRNYSWNLASKGGNRVAELLGTETMVNQNGSMNKCCFTNVRLPLTFKADGESIGKGEFSIHDASRIGVLVNAVAFQESDTYLQIGLHRGILWVRLSGQIYLEFEDFEWIGAKLEDLCRRIREGTIKI
ncbi:hypothetical protein HYFRA_00004798 [Hymenoscyphus fraxineus]|uniref:Aminotransferase class V domain-containing protein n=1 Tax=Hymenoscyphus fraxineus TaxID=746836 RepID=A0A9N9PMQ1_9HELO|nr:hypothetical protein HYFRA_00004798 [Hymenoscyphus fraxineus]